MQFKMSASQHTLSELPADMDDLGSLNDLGPLPPSSDDTTQIDTQGHPAFGTHIPSRDGHPHHYNTQYDHSMFPRKQQGGGVEIGEGLTFSALDFAGDEKDEEEEDGDQLISLGALPDLTSSQLFGKPTPGQTPTLNSLSHTHQHHHRHHSFDSQKNQQRREIDTDKKRDEYPNRLLSLSPVDTSSVDSLDRFHPLTSTYNKNERNRGKKTNASVQKEKRERREKRMKEVGEEQQTEEEENENRTAAITQSIMDLSISTQIDSPNLSSGSEYGSPINDDDVPAALSMANIARHDPRTAPRSSEVERDRNNERYASGMDNERQGDKEEESKHERERVEEVKGVVERPQTPPQQRSPTKHRRKSMTPKARLPSHAKTRRSTATDELGAFLKNHCSDRLGNHASSFKLKRTLTPPVNRRRHSPSPSPPLVSPYKQPSSATTPSHSSRGTHYPGSWNLPLVSLRRGNSDDSFQRHGKGSPIRVRRMTADGPFGPSIVGGGGNGSGNGGGGGPYSTAIQHEYDMKGGSEQDRYGFLSTAGDVLSRGISAPPVLRDPFTHTISSSSSSANGGNGPSPSHGQNNHNHNHHGLAIVHSRLKESVSDACRSLNFTGEQVDQVTMFAHQLETMVSETMQSVHSQMEALATTHIYSFASQLAGGRPRRTSSPHPTTSYPTSPKKGYASFHSPSSSTGSSPHKSSPFVSDPEGKVGQRSPSSANGNDETKTNRGRSSRLPSIGSSSDGYALPFVQPQSPVPIASPRPQNPILEEHVRALEESLGNVIDEENVCS